jgi:hypothetical protein
MNDLLAFTSGSQNRLIFKHPTSEKRRRSVEFLDTRLFMIGYSRGLLRWRQEYSGCIKYRSWNVNVS